MTTLFTITPDPQSQEFEVTSLEGGNLPALASYTSQILVLESDKHDSLPDNVVRAAVLRHYGEQYLHLGDWQGPVLRAHALLYALRVRSTALEFWTQITPMRQSLRLSVTQGTAQHNPKPLVLTADITVQANWDRIGTMFVFTTLPQFHNALDWRLALLAGLNTLADHLDPIVETTS